MTELINSLPPAKILDLSKLKESSENPIFRLLTTLKKRAFKNIVEKGENAGDQHFLVFPQIIP